MYNWNKNKTPISFTDYFLKRDWNSIPISIKTLSINAFKKRLKEHYLSVK